MLLAVLEKKSGFFKLATKDVFLNITGGISVDDPAIDLSSGCRHMYLAMKILPLTKVLFCRRNRSCRRKK